MKDAMRKLLQRHIGQKVELLITNGESVGGTLRSVDDDYVCCDSGTAKSRFAFTVALDVVHGIMHEELRDDAKSGGAR